MTSENIDAVENSATETPVAKRPRRATRAATAPTEATGTSPAGTTPAVEPTTGTAAPEVAAEKPVAAPRRRTRKAATTEDAPAAAEGAPSGSATAEVAESSTAPVRKATRSRKKVVAPADAVEEVVETAAAGTAAPEEATEAPAAKKRPSRAKKKPAADEVPAAVEAPAAAEVPASPEAPAAEVPTVTGAAGTATPAPAAPKRRRATRKAAAPSDAPTAGAGSTASASAEAVTPETATPEAVTPDAVTPGTATPDAAVSEVATPAAEPVEAEEDEETAEPVTDAQGVALDVLAAFSGVTPEPEKPTASSGRLATTALLFQAPETAPRRRRRASAPAGSPEEIAAAAHAEAAEPEAVVADAADTAETAESTGGSRRSRGRRGGRKRSGQPTEETVEEAAEAAPVEAEDEVAEDQTAEQSEGEDTEDGEGSPRRRRRRGGRGRRSRAKDGDESADTDDESGAEEDDESAEDQTAEDSDDEGSGGSSRRRRRRRRSSRGGDGESSSSSSSGRSSSSGSRDEVTALRGSTRLEAKRQRRREGRDAGRRRQIITEAEFLARRESVDRSMIVRELDGRTQIAVLEDGVLVEHYVSKQAQASMVGNVYLGRVQNVLPSMEAAFVDVGRGRNAVLYAGEVNWDAAGVEGGKSRRIEQALKSGDPVLVQVTKDPIGHKGARLTSQVTLAGRYLVYVPGGGMTGISRKLPDNERSRLKKILREVVPDSAGVIVRTAAEGASEEELRADIARLQSQWEAIEKKSASASAPALLQGEPDMAIRVVRDIFNDDFNSLVIQGDEAWSTISGYIGELAPDLAEKVSKYTGTGDVFHDHRVDEQLAKGMDRKVWLPSGGSLVIDRTEAMTVVDVNTGKFTGAGGTLEETVTRNNLEAAEEIVRQLRLRDIGGMIVIDFIDMVLESNRDLVLRRLVECLGRDRTKHQVAEVTSLGLVQMTRKRVGQGLVEAFSETCEHCHGRGFIVHTEPVERSGGNGGQHQHQPQPEKSPAAEGEPKRSRRKRGGSGSTAVEPAADKDQAGVPVLPEAREQVNATLATIAAAAAHAHQHEEEETPVATPESPVVASSATAEVSAEAERPYLDVFAALGELGTSGEDPAEPVVEESSLALTPVDPSLFEDGEPMPETSIEDLSTEDQAAEQQEQ
ncbi:ribonuclease E/G [Cellulomonas fimi]|uniref:Rne/Rng family ribonuclease n=1 Tax=Cellulomonas sp. RIT-PI-Y TaxID=3035297 RepID=UPI0021D82E9A